MSLPVVILLAVAVVASVAAVALGIALSRSRARHTQLADQLAAARAEHTALQARFSTLAAERAAAGPAARVSAETRVQTEAAPPHPDYVITTLADGPEGDVDERRAEDRSFASVAAAESLVRAASLAQGVRRALSAEARNRIRFEMGREVKRSRKQRRRNLRTERRTSTGSSVVPNRTVEEDAA